MTTLVSIDTTPNPNSMKLNLNDTFGITETFTRENLDAAPVVIQQLLQIDGVQSLFTTERFLTLNRDPRAPWQPLLEAAKAILAGEGTSPQSMDAARPSSENLGEIKILVQTFRGIPIQVKATDGIEEVRVGLSPRFGETARELQTHFGADYLKERHWADWDIRYGSLSEVAREMGEEMETLLNEATLAEKRRVALGEVSAPATQGEIKTEDSTPLSIAGLDWPDRFRLIQQLEASETALPLLLQALHDEKPQIRRWAAAKLSGVKSARSVSALSEALLSDTDTGVRRTAGDSLSDIGDVSAQAAICQALGDKNKLVRWRAARFLAEVGTEKALPALEAASNDVEYEVRLEIEAAIQHIRAGSKAAGPVWKLMSQEAE